MNKFSKAISFLGLIACVGGGVTLAIGAAQGGDFKEAIKEDHVNVYQVLELKKDDEGSDKTIDIDMDLGNINLYNSLDESLKIEYKASGELARLSKDIDNTRTRIDIKYKWLFNNISIINAVSSLVKPQSSLDIYLPTWYTQTLKINLVCGQFESSTSQLSNIDLNLVTGSASVKKITKIKDMNLNITTGSINCDLTNLLIDELTPSVLNLDVVVGEIKVAVSKEMEYKISKCNVTVGSCNVGQGKDDAKLDISADVKTGNIEIYKK